MKKSIVLLAGAALLASALVRADQIVTAQSDTAVGGGFAGMTGLMLGAAAGGPVGALVGGAAGLWTGAQVQARRRQHLAHLRVAAQRAAHQTQLQLAGVLVFRSEPAFEIVLLRALEALQGERYLRLAEKRPGNYILDLAQAQAQ